MFLCALVKGGVRERERMCLFVYVKEEKSIVSVGWICCRRERSQ